MHIQLARNLLLFTAYFVMTVSASGVESASGNDSDDEGWALFVDQDLLALDTLTGLNDDRDYTMGVEIAFFGDRTKDWWLYGGLHAGVDKVSNLLRLAPNSYGDRKYSVSVGNTAFTPDNYGPREPQFDDRPFSSLLYFSASQTWISSDQDRAISNRLNVGILGLDIGKAVQYEIHHWQSGTSPRGWDNQLADDHPEPTFLFHHNRKYLLFNDPERDDLFRNMELSWKWDVNAGWYINTGASVLMRWGKINSHFYNHFSDPLNTANQLLSDDADDFYFFAQAGARAVAYNQLLQGAWFSSSPVEFDSDELRHFVQHYSGGITKTFNHFTLTYSFNYSTSDVKASRPEADRDHAWGGLYFVFDVD